VKGGKPVVGRRHPDAELVSAVDGATVLVTGASSGIGAAAAWALGRAGGETVLVARSADRLEEMRERIQEAGGSACAHPADLSDAGCVARLVEEVDRCHGGVDILVNNAGHSIRRSIELSYGRVHDFERTIDVNYLGPVGLVLGFLPGMRARRRGHIVNVSSLGVLFGAPRFSAYLGSKSAFETFLRCIAPEVRPDGVAITDIYMPLVHTPMVEATRVYRLLPGLTADEAAERICRAIARRPRRVGPISGYVGRTLSDIAPGPFDRVLGLTYRWSTDSAAARGEAGDDVEVPALVRSTLRRLGHLRAPS